ncbi:hypothetical protein [Chromobacterium subtsugae]|uniref:hypothetical protein n=1 Tax=Chromobacterium subtsugae TaxID=251747 RepID=UPI000B1B4C27|nr:hypothetical protein [Chromobacterium subtsugae]
MTFHLVADHLSSEAGKKTGTPPADAFARTAFNRYYYAVYLAVREFIGEFETDWKRTTHAKVPEIVEFNLAKKIKREADKLKKHNSLSESEYSRIIRISRDATKDIAGIMKSAYSIRCISDYEPEVPIEFSNSQFSIKSTSSAEAKNWERRIQERIGQIKKITKEVGLD